jgi:acetoacetyl-CoA synthetase
LRYHKQRTIRQKLTPRHVPAEVIAVADIPYTRSGKKVEVAVTRAIHGEKVRCCACRMCHAF